jgi:hypothetical protein
MRQIHDADKSRKGKRTHQCHHHGSKSQPENSSTTTRQPSSSAVLEDYRFLDNSSVDMSLYTTPSRATLQYHRGVHHLHDWQSHDSSVTPEVASVQSRLGGWEAPPPPRPAAEGAEENEIVGSRTAKSSQIQPKSLVSRRNDASSSRRGGQGTSFRQRQHDAVFRARITTSIQSSLQPMQPLQAQGPVDVDSMSFVEDKFSDLLSTFEDQSLAGRMAPNTARTHHERSNCKTRTIGKTTRNDYPSKRSESCGTTSGRENAATMQSERGRTSTGFGSRKPTRHSSISYSPSKSANNTYQTDTYSTVEEYHLDFDDSRSLATEVSCLTMLTMEQQSVQFQSRTSEAASPLWTSHRPRRSITSESQTRSTVPEDAIFSGLSSRSQDESIAGMLAPTSNNSKTQPISPEGDTTRSFTLENCFTSRSQQTQQDPFLDSRQGPMHSNLSGVSTAVMDQGTFKKFRGIEAETLACQELPETICSGARAMASLYSKHSNDDSMSEKKLIKSKPTEKESFNYVAHDGLTPSEIDYLPIEELFDEVSFSGLFSTIEAESLAGRLAATTPLQNVEIPDSQSEAMSSTESFKQEFSFDLHRNASNSDQDGENVDGLAAGPLTPITRTVSADISSVKSTMKRSDTNPACDIAMDGSCSLAGTDDATRFSIILSTSEAGSVTSSKLEPPAAKRLLSRDGHPHYIKETTGDENSSSVTQRRDSPSIVTSHVNSTTREDTCNEDENERTDNLAVEVSSADNASVPSTLVEDDYSTDSRCSMTIDDQSTIPPPPNPDDCSWNGNNWNSGRKPEFMFASAGSTEVDAMSNMSSIEVDTVNHILERENPINDYDVPSREGQDGPDIVSTGTEPKLTPIRAVENIRQDSESIETSLQYSESAAPGNVVSDVSSLLVSAEKHRNLPKTQNREGPIDLDESVAESNSERSSSWCSSASVVDPTQNTPSKPTINEHLQVQSPLSCDDEDDYHFVDDDDEVGDNEDKEFSFSSLHNETYVNEATVEHSYKETMESLSSVRYESGSLLLTESELKKHIKSTQFKGSLPSSNLRGYDTWKRKQIETQGYFAVIHQQAMKLKEKRDRLLEHSLNPSQGPHHRGAGQRELGVSATVPTVAWSVSSTTQTSRTSEPIPRRSNGNSSEPRKGWGFLRGGVLKNVVGRPVTRTVCSSPRRKHDPAIDYATKVSEDEPDDISLLPMNKLDPGVVTLTSSIPLGDSLLSTKSHNSDDIGPRLLALQHLEMERAKNRDAEEEKTKLEIREQKRIAMLKEKELERQRRLNAPRAGNSGQTILSSKSKCKSQGSITDQFLERNLSFGTTNSVQSSIKSPSCVLSPCILCNAAERSHVAQPCMHFYFCQDCANQLRSSATPVCPICATPNISFSRVYT